MQEAKDHNKLEDFFDEDPTEELPILTGVELPDQHAAGADTYPAIEDQTGEVPILKVEDAATSPIPEPAPTAPGGIPSLSLQRLEAEIESLQERFIDLEADLRLRDDEIELLQAELQKREQAIEDLGKDL